MTSFQYDRSTDILTNKEYINGLIKLFQEVFNNSYNITIRDSSYYTLMHVFPPKLNDEVSPSIIEFLKQYKERLEKEFEEL